MRKRATEPSWSKCLVRIHGDGRQAHALWCWNWTANACSALDPEATVRIEPFQCRRSLPDSRRATLHKNCFSKFVSSRCAEALPVRPAVGGASMSVTAEAWILKQVTGPSSDYDAKEEFFRAIGQAIANALLDQ